MEHTRHLWRAAALLILLLVTVIVVRHFVVPDSFGQHGFYRYDAVDEFMALETVHGPEGVCLQCHDGSVQAAGAHALVQCESCHAPLATHILDEEVTAPMAVDRTTDLCTRCHLRMPARPAFMPVIDVREHLELEAADIVPVEACLECHEAHDPGA